MATLPVEQGMRRTDGRRARSQSSRARIIAAMLDLIGRGEHSPSAAQIAAEAGVGLRSVFRHFEDMDSLYREMSDHIEAMVLPIIIEPLKSVGWQNRVREQAARRAHVFEIVLPYRLSANQKRFQSAFLMDDYRRMLRLGQTSLEAILPPEVLADTIGVQALNAALGFQNWRLLRYDQQLSLGVASAVMLRMVESILAGFDKD